MREMKVKNASVYANLGARKIDFEIRTTKNSNQGFALFVDGVKWIDVILVGSALKDDKECGGKKPLFEISDIKSNGCL